jgi:hypothetical protein
MVSFEVFMVAANLLRRRQVVLRRRVDYYSTR